MLNQYPKPKKTGLKLFSFHFGAWPSCGLFPAKTAAYPSLESRCEETSCTSNKAASLTCPANFRLRSLLGVSTSLMVLSSCTPAPCCALSRSRCSRTAASCSSMNCRCCRCASRALASRAPTFFEHSFLLVNVNSLAAFVVRLTTHATQICYKVKYMLNKTNEVKFLLTIYSYFDVSMIMVIIIKKNKYLKKSQK